ncbi:hypothetical protein BJY21_002653 [Kineosphaera limosa]|uniref:Uncharacterized protein n=1 Tax=Kineosphaera limosa NBRC 100340 TaxID=1184609 RepID=K6X8S0_9MICO|nr:hypothetical protein [Kineosphaera limosa]NYE01469.1 hypothetical protein [Kineosphaera limosa]GAB95214.1 hypothetical protein KILIM_017_00590 [Kineosphaera limosa NBRC 100340]
MLEVIIAGMWVVTGCGIVLLALAAIGRAPRRVALGVAGIAYAATLVGLGANIVLLVQGWRLPDLATHLGYLISLPFIIPAGYALTYKKIDRWGLVILGVATLIGAIMIVRQVQTLGIPFGYLNV